MFLSSEKLFLILSLRTRIRNEEGGGGCCHLVSDEIADLFGFPRQSGTYTDANGEVICSAHVWNILPNGIILDATADQFGEGQDIALFEPGSIFHQRYRLEWYEDYNPNLNPDTPLHLSTWTGELDGEQQNRLRNERGQGWWINQN